mmetsp:Transcript_10058/g.22217  ORF Transcript_10058/g.22217 Transcript_10058/m.22217 type:complete len:586 (-) Transcript_10058:25-1782(-)
MPLDKSRIQGFGSDGTVTTGPKITECPRGHPLKQWSARQGWCDQCGKKVHQGEEVMDCRICNWYLCTKCRPLDPQDQSGFWGSLSGMVDQVGGPGMTSAFDSFALQVNDVIQAATEEFNEMGQDIKSFVNSAIGLEDSEEEQHVSSNPGKQPQIILTAEQKIEASKIVERFCTNYPAYRVAPKPEEMETMLRSASNTPAAAMSIAMYDQLSFANGDPEWQPRLRLLHLLQYCLAKGGGWKELARQVGSQGEELLKHLVEVPQCKDLAVKVYTRVLGRAAAAEAGFPVPSVEEETAAIAALEAAVAQASATSSAQNGKAASSSSSAPAAAAAAKKAAAPTPAPAVDLLDFGAPSTSSSGAAAAAAVPKVAAPKAPAKQAARSAGEDLLGGFDEAPPPTQPAQAKANNINDLDFLNSTAFSPSAPAPASTGSGLGDLNLLTAAPATSQLGAGAFGAQRPQQAGMNAFPAAGAPQQGNFGALGGGYGGMMPPSPGAAGTGALGAFGKAAPYQSMGMPQMGANSWGGPAQQMPTAPNPSTTVPQPSVSSSTTRGDYTIPNAAEVNSFSMAKSKDPFDFLSQHTGIGDAK